MDSFPQKKSFLPKKSLGQHFLRSKAVLETMCLTAHVALGDTVLEIGPGEGTLTAALLEKGANVIAVEKDRRLIPELEGRFSAAIAEKKLVLKEVDALDFEPTEIQAKQYKLVANIPYYITGAILERFLSAEKQPSRMVLLVQKEVAQRIVARDGKESILSMSIKAYGQPRYIKTVSRRLFSPAPKVDSAILAIEDISKKSFSGLAEEELFFKILKAGFGHKRKMLKNNLADIADERGIKAELALEKADIPERARAEEVPLAGWIALVKIVGLENRS